MDLCYTAIPAGPTESDIAALYTDACGGSITVVKSGAPTGDDCNWSVTYTYTVRDKCNNYVADVPSVTYSGGDRTAPVLTGVFPTGQADMNLCYTAIPAGPTESDIAALYTDACGGSITVVKSGASTGDDCNWSVTYTYTVRDKCNNYVADVPSVTYSGGDRTAPVLTGVFPTGQADMNLCYTAIPAGPTESDIAALYTDACGGSITVVKSGAPTGDDCNWSVTYTYTVRDKCNNYVADVPSVTYSGGDRTAPVLTGVFPTGQADMNLCYTAIPAGPTESDIAALYTDACGGSITVVKSGAPTGDDCNWSVTYTYTVRDKCNNYVADVPSVTYSGGDRTAPVLTGVFPTGQADMNLCYTAIPAGPTESDIAALYTDACGGSITVVKSGAPTGDDCNWSVTYTYTVRDKCNNYVADVPSVTYSGGDRTAPVSYGGVPDGPDRHGPVLHSYPCRTD